MKVKFNSMDFIIIVILIAVVAALSWFMANRSSTSAAAQNKTVKMTVELVNKEKAFADIPKAGDAVVMGEKEKMDAVVTDVKVRNAVTPGYDILSGTIKESEIPDRYDVQITVSADGTESPAEVTINGTGVRVGMGVALKAKNWAGYGYAIDVDTVDKEVR